MSSKATEQRCGLGLGVWIPLWSAAVFSLAVLVLALLSLIALESAMTQKNREVVDARVKELLAWLNEGGVDGLQDRFVADLAGQHEAMVVRLVGPGEQDLFMSLPKAFATAGLTLPPALDPAGSGRWFEAIDNGESWIISSTPVDGSDFVLQVGMSTTQTWHLLSLYRWHVLWGVVPIGAISLLISWWFTSRALRPVRQMTATMQAVIGKGDMTQRVELQSHRGELAGLASLFNSLLDTNERLIDAMQDSLDTIAHDLRTPLTRLRNSAEGPLESQPNVAELRSALSDCLEESGEVLGMLDIFMDMAEARAGVMHLEISPLRIKDAVRDVVDLYEFVAEDRHVAIHTDLPDGVSVLADHRRFQQVLANLVDNAIKYSNSGGQVDIRAKAEGRHVLISVRDRGIGIPKDETEKIWARLFRGRLGQDRAGLGLGLGFSKAIVVAHGGTLAVESVENEGSTFTIRMPAAEAKMSAAT